MLAAVYRSQAWFDLGELDEARSDAERAIRQHAKQALLHHERRLEFLFAGQLPWALSLYSWAQALQVDDVLILEGRADAYRANGRFVEAIVDYDQVLGRYAKATGVFNADAAMPTLLARGWAWQSLGERERAVSDFEEVLATSTHTGLWCLAAAGLQELTAPVEQAPVAA